MSKKIKVYIPVFLYLKIRKIPKNFTKLYAISGFYTLFCKFQTFSKFFRIYIPTVNPNYKSLTSIPTFGYSRIAFIRKFDKIYFKNSLKMSILATSVPHN